MITSGPSVMFAALPALLILTLANMADTVLAGALALTPDPKKLTVPPCSTIVMFNGVTARGRLTAWSHGNVDVTDI